MKNVTLTLASVLALTAVATAMSAQTEMDADGDGTVTYSEMAAVYPEITEETFASLDANSDGGVDADELLAAQDAGLLPVMDG